MKDGFVDAAYLDTASANFLLNSDKNSSYTMTNLSGYEYYLASGIDSSSNDFMLYNILNKCIRYTSNSRMNELVMKYSLSGGTTVSALIHNIPLGIQFLVAMFLVAVILVLIIMIWSMKRRARAENDLRQEQEYARQQQQARLVAERTNSEMNEFFGNISHDMRTPLNGIMGFTDIAMSSDEADDMKGYLKKIHISAELLTDLVNDTLMISKLDSDKFTLDRETVSFSEVIDRIAVPIRSAAQEKGVAFILDDSKCDFKYVSIDKNSMGR